MNAAMWHRDTVQTLLRELLLEHLNHNVSRMDDLAALQLFRRIAQANLGRFATGDPAWQELAFALPPPQKTESPAAAV
jgi:cardiolipin synthase